MKKENNLVMYRHTHILIALMMGFVVLFPFRGAISENENIVTRP